jgi:hypothetical protein
MRVQLGHGLRFGHGQSLGQGLRAFAWHWGFINMRGDHFKWQSQSLQ